MATQRIGGRAEKELELKCNRKANSPSRRAILALTVEEPALRPHNFRVSLISQPLGAYVMVAGRRRPCEATRFAVPSPKEQ